MKKNFIRMAKLALVAASALAFMNCGDSATDAVANAVGNAIPSSSSAEPVIDPATGLPVADPAADPATAVDPITGEPVVTDPATTVDPVTGEVVPSGTDATVTEPAVDVPATDPVADPATEPAVDPVTDPATEPAVTSSSSEAVVASSSSEKVESSSSVEPVQEAPKGIFLTTDTDENKEYMEVEYIEHTGPDGGAILSYPKRLSDTQKHGIVVWGPGGGTEPGAYGGMIHRLASHGFVVIALSSSPGDASKAIPALDWLEQKSKDASGPLYNKLDFTKVGASGHSMGGLESEEVLIKDSRVITAVMNNSGNLGGGAAQYVPAGKTIALVYGEVGSEAPNAERDYSTNVTVPACLIKMEGNNFGHGSGPWDGIGATVSWMRWQLGGEDFRKADFVGTSGKYINGSVPGTPGHYNGQCKNF